MKEQWKVDLERLVDANEDLEGCRVIIDYAITLACGREISFYFV